MDKLNIAAWEGRFENGQSPEGKEPVTGIITASREDAGLFPTNLRVRRMGDFATCFDRAGIIWSMFRTVTQPGLGRFSEPGAVGFSVHARQDLQVASALGRKPKRCFAMLSG